MSLQLLGVPALLARLSRMAEGVASRKTKTAILKAAAQPIRDEAARLAPRRTGRLASSIGIAETDGGVAVGSDVPYAGHVEFGTAHQGAQPFMRPALDSKADRAISQVGKDLWEEISSEG